ncbi:hypothetical protein HYZ99_03245 [Candidatus Peregrinibacteria bacterium]|nr:hypothetical protein [Candidatus Peregrinibacteria bacterium]
MRLVLPSRDRLAAICIVLLAFVFVVPPVFPLVRLQAQAASDLVAAYGFNEGSGATLNDISGNNNNGSIFQATWTTTDKKYGASALNFDGSNDRVNITDNPNGSLDLTTGMTMEAWVRPTASIGWRTVILKEVPGELSYALYANSGNEGNVPSGFLRSGGSSYPAVYGSASLPTNAWSHLAVTYDASSLRLYLNGNLIRSTARTGSITTSNDPLRIGGNAVWGEYFRGQIDEVRIYKRALSATEIQADMNTPVDSAPDTTPPAVSVTAPTEGATVAGSVSVAATATDNVSVTGVQFKLDGINLGAEDTTSPYSISWNTTTASEGSHQLTAVARDAAGNVTTSSVVTVTVQNADTTPPSVSVTVPIEGSVLAGTISINVTASDNISVAGVQFKLDGINLGAEDTTSPYSISWNTTTASEGSHQLTAVARDAAGNSTTSQIVNVIVQNLDSEPPAVSLTAPSDGSTVTNVVNVAANATDNVSVAGVQFKLDGQDLGPEDTASPYSVSWNTLTAINGPHGLTAVARDAAGNITSSAVVNVAVENDTSAPTVSITAPASGSTLSAAVNVDAAAADNVGVAGVQFFLDGANLGSEDTASPYSVSWNTTTASNGNHTLAARARDAAGNQTTSTTVSVTVSNPDTTPPAVSVTSPLNGATVSGSIGVAATASDNVSVASVQFKLDGGNLGVPDTVAPYSISWNTATVPNGSHQLSAVATDQAGNVAASNVVNVTVSNGGGTPLTLDGAVQFQAIDGFGVSANAASWDNGELRPALDMLVDQNGSTLFRVIIDEADWEQANDNADPAVYDWTYYNSLFSTPKFEELWATMAYLNSKGITNNLMLNFMGRGPLWNGGSDLPTATAEDEWVETVTAVASYARNNRGLQFGLFAPTNEPDWDIYEGVRMDAFQLPRVFEKLANKLDAIGLGDLRLVGPDTAAVCTGVNSYVPEITGNATVMNKLDHFSFHNYAGDSCGAGAAMPPGKNFWITEVSNIWDTLAHIGQGPSAILVWDGYDSVYNHATRAGRGSTPPNDVGNGTALLSYDTGTRTYTPRKAFYEFAQLFKFVPGGSRRIAANEGNGNVTIYAFHHSATGRVTIVGRNAGAGDVNFSATLANLPAVPMLEFYVTDNSNNFTRGADIPVSGNAFSFTAPGNSVFTLTFSGTPDTLPPAVSVTSPSNGATASGIIIVSANAADNVGVTGVQFLLDGVNLSAEDTTSPYSVSWNTTTATNGSHTLTARARDAAGNQMASAIVNVTVSNVVDTTPPAVSMTAPANGATVTGAVTVAATAVDDVGVAGVQFLLDGANLGTEDTTSPYSISWNTTTASNGSHTLTARARDAAGNTAASSVTVTTANTQTTGTIIIDPSSPARVTGDTSVTTALFNPPNNALLLVLISADAAIGSDPNIAITNNGTAIPWTLIRERSIVDPGAQEGEASAFYALLPTGRTGMTVTATMTDQAKRLSMKVYVVSGHNTVSPIGASGEGSSTTNNITPSLYTSTVSNSLGFGVAADWNASGFPSSTDEEDAFHVAGLVSGLSASKAASTAGAGTSVTMNFDAAGTAATKWNWVGFEVRPGN